MIELETQNRMTTWWACVVSDEENEALQRFIDSHNQTRPPETRKLTRSAVIRLAIRFFLDSEYANNEREVVNEQN